MIEHESSILTGGIVLDPTGSSTSEADILIDGGRITAIVPRGAATQENRRRIDATGRLVIPGLVNAHTHSHFTFAKGLNPQWTLELHQNATPWMTGGASMEELRLSATLAAAEMVLKGCTSCYDMVVHPPIPTAEGLAAIAGAYEAVGMRAVVAMSIADRSFWEAIPGLVEAMPSEMRASVEALKAMPGETTLAGCEQVLRGWRHRLVRPAVAPTIPLLCSDDFLRGAAKLARQFGVGLHTHLAESKVQAVAARQRYGLSLTAHLDALGYLGPDLTAAHAVWVDEDELALLADSGVCIAHNPASNLRLGNGIAPVGAMRRRCIPVGLGTDACTCSDQLNMFEAMRLACLASRATSPDPEAWLDARAAFAMATEVGGRILGLGRIGRIEAGYEADLVLLELDHVNYVPLNDALTQIVFGENGAAVDSVIVGGRLVLDRRRFTMLDYDRLVAQVRKANSETRERNRARRDPFDAMETVVRLFCGSLTRAPHALNRYVGPDPGKSAAPLAKRA